jgi:hypothetical protein
MSIADTIQIIAILIAALGLFLSWRQLAIANRQKRAEYIINLYNQSALDKDVLDIYYKIEYGRFDYVPSEFHGGPDEIKLDKLLDMYDNIAKLYKLGNFTSSDLEYVAYRYLVVYQDKSVISYLEFVDSWYKQRGMRLVPFQAFREVGKELELRHFDTNR